MQIFARLTKVNEADRTIEGVIASETVDRSGEIFDYAKSKPNFMRWSQELGKATEGKNIGNVRAMHGNVSAGITKEMTFDDAAKEIVVKAEITDDNEWRKVLKGNYTGLSIGGRYAEKWEDPDLKKTRYAADPTEYSLVDLPCNPDATFTVVKGDGIMELHKFNVIDEDALLKALESLDETGRTELLAKIAKRPNVDPNEGKDKYGADADFADPTNKKYPLKTDGKWDFKKIRAAWSYIHMPRNADKYSAEDVAQIKARIVAAWKAVKGVPPPEAKAKAEKLAKRAAAAPLATALWQSLGGAPVEKGLWAVSQFAQLLDALAIMADNTETETVVEGDDSDLPKTMRDALKPLAQAFLAMAEEETNEALHGELNDDAAIGGDPLQADKMAKVGRKHTKKTREHHAAIREHLDKAREHLDALQADDPAMEDDDAQKLAKAATDLQKITAERDELAKALTESNTQLAALLKQPAPAKGAARAVEKSVSQVPEPTASDDKPVLKADGTVDHAATAVKLTKAIYANGPQVIRR